MPPSGIDGVHALGVISPVTFKSVLLAADAEALAVIIRVVMSLEVKLFIAISSIRLASTMIEKRPKFGCT
jgi:hypothetical protein